jgi:ABC-type transport system involved in multi-copper enzyme maturation permease subunit
MKFLRQVKFEIKNILMSKFLLIIGILVMLCSIALPIVSLLSPKSTDIYYPGPILYGNVKYESSMVVAGGKEIYMNGQEPITIDGIVINADNPFYWNLSGLLSQQESIQDGTFTFTNTDSANLALDLFNAEIDYYMHYVKSGIADYNDYRIQLQGDGITALCDKFIFEHNSSDPAALYEVSQMGGIYYDQDAFNKKYIGVTSEIKLASIDVDDEYINKLYDVIDNGNFPVFIELSVQQQQNYIKNSEDQIAIFQQNIIDHPDQEESFNTQIEDLQKQIDFINNETIPMLQYRQEKNIIPGLNIWQNTAISDIENSESWLMYNKILTEDDFNKPDNQYLLQQYGTYARYLSEMTAQKNEYENTELVARKCLDAEKPDMKYVPDGARTATVKFLDYSIIVALFAVLLGGWIMGSEFQLGTIRLLLIRPKTRTKILMSKFIAALIVCLAIYIIGSIVNIIANGICFGFSDYAFPNYSVSGETGFFAVYLPEFISCSVSIIFAFCVAFMLSMLIKNIAVSIIIPVVCFIGCFLAMNTLAGSRIMEWIAYTPIPYVQLSSFFMPHSTSTTYSTNPVLTLIQRGVPLDLTYGIIMLLVLGALCVFISIISFRKKDITN